VSAGFGRRREKEETLGRLAGRVAIVTGAASGIGRAIAETYAREGAALAILDKNGEGIGEVGRALAAAGASVYDAHIDVRDYRRVREFRDEVVGRFGRIDVLVNNAGIGYEGEFMASNLEGWREVIQVNLEAVYVGSKLAAEAMIGRGGGRIINISSVQALRTTGRTAPYNAAKSGLLGLTHALAVEMAPHNVVANAIAPGFIHTGMSILADGTDETTTPDFLEYFLRRRRIPLARVGTAEDVAGTALFLASDDCRYMTGQTLIVDGGMTLTI
jgi:NAD(P)-dependent dehydrogenase (short-subunit alcohol dehydrogenase family)